MKSDRHFIRKYLSLRLRYKFVVLDLIKSAVNHFLSDDFFGSVTDRVHGLYPQHLIVCFHGFGHTLGLFHLLNDKAAPFRCLFVQVSKVSMQFAG